MLSKILLTTPLFNASEMADILSEALAATDKSDSGKVSVEDVLNCVLTAIEENFYCEVRTAIKDECSPYSYFG
jgi:hypothetical protein